LDPRKLIKQLIKKRSASAWPEPPPPPSFPDTSMSEKGGPPKRY
jgi:hypothetical protein